MKNTFYAIKAGREGSQIVNTWEACSKMVDGYPNAQHKKFDTREEANAYITGMSLGDYIKSISNLPHHIIKVGDQIYIDFVKRGEVLIEDCPSRSYAESVLKMLREVATNADYMGLEPFNARHLELARSFVELDLSGKYKRNRHYAVKSFKSFVTRNQYKAMLFTEGMCSAEARVFRTEQEATAYIEYTQPAMTIDDYIVKDNGQYAHAVVYCSVSKECLRWYSSYNGYGENIGSGVRTEKDQIAYGAAYGEMCGAMKAVKQAREDGADKLRIFYYHNQVNILEATDPDEVTNKYIKWMIERTVGMEVLFTQMPYEEIAMAMKGDF